MISAVGGNQAWGMQSLSVTSAAQRHKMFFDRLDTDGDGKITVAELAAGRPADRKAPGAEEIMKMVDTDGDGTINESENDAFLSKMDQQRPPMGRPDDAGSASAAERHKNIFDKLDTNHDGKVSAEELAAAKPADGKGFDVAEIMKLADTDGDGTISKEENETFLSKMEEQMRSLMQAASSYNGQGMQQPGIVGNFVNTAM